MRWGLKADQHQMLYAYVNAKNTLMYVYVILSKQVLTLMAKQITVLRD